MPNEGPDSTFLDSDGAPDWDAVDFDVLCSRCGYNLRTLTSPLCTECGLAFEWPDVLHTAATRSEFLFEHHWRDRPVRSWLTTVGRSFRPRSFWAEVSIHDRIEVRPLVFLLLSAVATFLVLLHGMAFVISALLGLGLTLTNTPQTVFDPVSRGMIEHHLWTLSSNLHSFAIFPLSDLRYLSTLSAMIVGVFLAMFVFISSMWQTLGKHRIRGVQVFRVVAYVAVAVSVEWSIVVLACVFVAVVFVSNVPEWIENTIALCGYSTMYVVPAVYLSCGLRRYLRLQRPKVMGFTAVLVAILFVLAVFSVVNLYVLGSL